MSEPDSWKRDGRRLVLLLAVAVAAVGLAGWAAYSVASRYNPFFDRTPAHRDARRLMEAARHRPLTEVEFMDCLELCATGDSTVQLWAMVTAQAAAGRTPEYVPRAVGAFEWLAATADPPVAGAAKKSLRRLKP